MIGIEAIAYQIILVTFIFIIFLICASPLLNLLQNLHWVSKSSILLSSGFSISTLISYIIGSFTNKTGSTIQVIFILISLYSLLRIYLYAKRDLKIQKIQHRFKFFAVIIIAGLIPVMIPLIFFAKKNYLMPVFTQGNNDIGQYVISAEAFLRGGFSGHDFVMNQNEFNFVKVNDFGGPSFLSWISTLLNVHTWMAVLPALIFCISATTLSFCSLYRAITNNEINIKVIFISLIASCGAVSQYLVSNIFLSQLIASWLWINVITLLITFNASLKLKNKLFSSFLISIILSGIFLTYPHMFLLDFGLASLAIVATTLISNDKFPGTKKISILRKYLIYCIVIPVLLTFVLNMFYAISGLKLLIYRATASNGWPMPNKVTIINLLFLGDYSRNFQNIAMFLSLLILVLYLWRILMRYVFATQKDFKVLLVEWLVILGPIFIYSVLSIIYGQASYKAWKALFSYAPIIIFLVLFKMINSRMKLLKFVLATCSILIIIPNIVQSAQIIRENQYWSMKVSSKDMFDLHSQLKSLNLKSINIDANPYFESMYLAAITPSERVYINNATYAPTLKYKNSCTLVRNDKFLKKGTLSDLYLKINDTYSIVNLPAYCQIK